ncbi:ATP-dependent helicase HrpB [Paenibacillus athensensis]|uniref:ATP-dependent helicase HrpB n=2 Tax=Paenibacillus athensensis TaxID=1967502 RepID=A0A4Y8QBJ6_9BACL|nr:ATP-dependent helicase HrpB [Paenibacillus athensensis]
MRSGAGAKPDAGGDAGTAGAGTNASATGKATETEAAKGLAAGATPNVRAEETFEIAPLYGSMPQEAQDRALAPGRPGVRKIVLATSIAETSLTVEGVSIVVDSGLMRVPRFSPRTGMTRLDTVPVAQASADQRRGRAGRLGPGVCYRLWTEAEHRRLAPNRTPEIREADLAPLALELAAWGADPGELLWLDPPPEAAYAQARTLLTQLGALGADGALTAHGRELAGLGAHPRLAHMLVQARALGLGATACELAALLSERDLLRGEARRDADLRTRLAALRDAARPGAQPDGGVDLALAKRVLAEAKSWQQALGIRAAAGNAGGSRADDCGALLLYAYPDRIAMLRADGRFLLSSGRGAALADKQLLSGERFLVCAELDDHGADSRIELAAPIAEHELLRHAAAQLAEERDVRWDAAGESVKARRRVKLGALTLLDTPLAAPDAEEVAAALLGGVRASGLALLPWSRAARQLQERVVFLHRLDTSWPDLSDEALLAGLEQWLLPHLSGCRSRSDLQRLPLHGLLEELLPWEQRRKLGEWAPTHIQVPSGSRIPVDYSDPEAPALSVRLQEMFGLLDTPRIGGGRMPLTIHLLSPAQRPVQVTRDLASFWRHAYFEVKKDLKGRYPKHYWPDDPLIAQPTSRAKPRV